MNRPNRNRKRQDKLSNSTELPTRSEKKRAFFVLTITFLGGAIIFTSWLIQNYYRSLWTEEIAYLEKTQFLIEIEELKASQWQIQLHLESKRQPPNKSLYSSAAYNYIRSVSTLIAWEEARVLERSNQMNPIVVKDIANVKANSLFEKKMT